MNKKISKITLTAIPKVLTALIHEIINAKKFKSYDLKVRASYEQTKICIQEKEGHILDKEDWKNLLNFIDINTENLAFSMLIEYI